MNIFEICKAVLCISGTALVVTLAISIIVSIIRTIIEDI